MRWWKSEVVALFCGRRRRAGRRAGMGGQHDECPAACARQHSAHRRAGRPPWQAAPCGSSAGRRCGAVAGSGGLPRQPARQPARGPTCQPMMRKCGKRNWPRYRFWRAAWVRQARELHCSSACWYGDLRRRLRFFVCCAAPSCAACSCSCSYSSPSPPSPSSSAAAAPAPSPAPDASPAGSCCCCCTPPPPVPCCCSTAACAPSVPPSTCCSAALSFACSSSSPTSSWS